MSEAKQKIAKPTKPVEDEHDTNGVPEDLPVIASDLPVMYEDEGQEEMGETRPHLRAIITLLLGIEDHLAGRPRYSVQSDMNLYYHYVDRWAYVSPDVMVVVTDDALPEELRSYRIGVTGPAPILTVEVLSRRSAQQQDLTNKPEIYSRLGVREYLLADPTGEFLPQRLELRRREADGSWTVLRDADGGVTSELGFRVVVDESDHLQVVNAETGEPYLRHAEARVALDQAKRDAEKRRRELQERDEQIRKLEEQLAKSQQQSDDNPSAQS